MNGPWDCHTEWNKSDTGKTNIWYCLYVESEKKKGTNELIYKTEVESWM